MSGTLRVSPASSPFPYAAAAVATYTQKADLDFDETASGISLELNGTKITEEDQIVLSLAKAGGLSDDSSKVRLCMSPIGLVKLTLPQSQAFLTLAKSLSKSTAVPEIIASLDSVDDHLAFRTFLVGHEITAADWMLWGAIKGTSTRECRAQA